MRKRVLLGVGVGLAALAGIAVGVLRHREDARLASRVEELHTKLQDDLVPVTRPVPPGQVARHCDVAAVLAEAVALGPALPPKGGEALESFVAGPDEEGASEIAPILSAWRPALARWFESAACDTRGPLTTPLDARPLRLVLAAHLAQLRWRDDPRGLIEGIDAWIVARELMNAGGVSEYLVAADLATDAASGVEEALLAPGRDDRADAADTLSFVADHAAPLSEAVVRELWRRTKRHLATIPDDKARMAAIEADSGVLDAWWRAVDEPEAVRAAALRVLDPPPTVTDLPKGRELAVAGAQVSALERVANGLVIAAALTTFVEKNGVCPRDLDAARTSLPKEAWRDTRAVHLVWDESACTLTVRGVDGAALRVWAIQD